MTEPTESRHARLLALQDRLHHVIGVAPARDYADLLERKGQSGARSLLLEKAGAPVILDHHFELTCDLLVHDDRFGTVGIVHLIDDVDGGGTSKSRKARIQEIVESAAYLRHLALSKAKAKEREGEKPQLPLTVELVLVVSASGEGSTAEIGNVLRELALDSNFLHGIGINLLPWTGMDGEDDGGEDRDADLRCAFCWTLSTLTAWFGTPDASASPVFGGIEVTNWRLPGRRRLKFAEDARVHMVHGANGTGKSSLVEAIEYLATGKIARLPGIEPIGSIVEHIRHGETAAREPATATFLEPRHERCSTRSGSPPANLGLPSAGAFRLDQPVMDQLIRSDDAGRAKFFLDTFFPDYSSVSEDFTRAEQDAAVALARLPPRFLGSLPEDTPDMREAVLARLAWMDGPTVAVQDLWTHCFVLSREELEAQIPFAPTLDPLLREAEPARLPVDAVPGWLARFDSAIGALAQDADAHLVSIAEALRILRMTGLANWVPSDATSGKATAQALNTWLRSATAVTIMRRHIQIVRSFDRAHRASERPFDAILPAPLRSIADPSPGLLTAMDGDLRRLVREEEETRKRVAGLGRSARAGSGEGAVRPALTEAQVRSLDQVTDLLFRNDPAVEGGLGRAVSRALAENKTLPVGADTIIGMKGWARSLEERLSDLAQALEPLRAVQVRHVLPGEVWNAFIAARDRHLDTREAAKTLNDQFVTRLLDEPVPTRDGAKNGPSLDDALGELMTILTAARWAYPLIGVQPDTREGKPALGIRVGKVRQGELRLNSAELSLLTIALFLLCAPKVNNPLRLLVLDDPLQNMDEMTVTVLARGLAKLSMLLSADWMLLLLFHGEDDFERVRQEVPGAAYRLPWLMPVGNAEDESSYILDNAMEIWHREHRQTLASLSEKT
ncbi:hypothetical protein [Azospirillum brasilense]|uniref:hypothetical protein n=1 Tax=Azospirillum brasilense TaxID=192 RepID=UPI000E683655|nr:hypothetical protein [Azospirillum brasilense]NUB27013.1 hypothetical protein [Azospirillum brasilense]NUB34781.1 hypothetical protein [Azospirillum brasilense]RIW01161.1 hypothetical protein D2T81_19115 [Azospirillum brasilense]